ncbi:BMP family ABC transporter substrate-binding protein [Consotaella aegiceratis]|uniref:BMP family ABC transporter substrate-binding protein n=1 Tax=Consotaella aegiceratis TaxID=3097961 RepID=UPI002F3ED88E
MTPHLPWAAGLAMSLVLAAVPANAQEDDLSAAFLYVGPRADNGWTSRHEAGRQCLEEDGIKTTYVESAPEGPDVARIEQDFIDSGYDVIFATAFGYQPFTQQVAQANPHKHFFGILPTIAPGDNIRNFYGKLWDGRYLTGLVAGKMTKSNKIGFVAAQPIPSVIAGINAFTLGVKAVNPDAVVNVVWTLSWFDPPAEKQAAVALVQAGNDVIAQHQDTGSAAQGAAEEGAYAIGSEADMSEVAGDHVLTGTVWNWCDFYKSAIASVKNGTFEPGDQWGGLADGMVDLAPMSEDVPQDLVDLVKKQKQEIIDGKLDYWKGPLKDNEGNVAVEDGKTVSLDEIQGMRWFVEGVNGTLPSK